MFTVADFMTLGGYLRRLLR